MIVQCPKCHGRIDAANINVQSDSALCSGCGEMFAPSMQLERGSRGAANYNHAAHTAFAQAEASPRVQLQQDGNDWTISWKRRNIISGLFIGVFLTFWGGFSVGGIYVTPFLNGQLDLQNCLFGLPFLLGSVVLFSMVMFSFFGRVVMQKQQRTLKYFVGVAGIGIYRRFDLDALQGINVIESGMKQNNQAYHCLELGSSGQAKVGSKQLLRTLPGGKAYGDFLYIGGFLIKHLGNKN